MKIVITVGTYYPQTNGVQAVTTYLAEGMARYGHEIVVITIKNEGNLEEEYHNGVHILRCNISTIHAIHRGDISGYRRLVIKQSKDADAIVIVCPQIVTTDSLLPILSSIKCKKILYMHGMHNFSIRKYELENFSIFCHKMWNEIRWAWLYFCHKKWFRQFDKIIQIHRFDGTFDFVLKNYGIKSDIIGNAADDAFFNIEAKKENKISCEYLLNVSNFIPRKNQLAILEAYYKSKTSMALVFIGSSKTEYYNEIVRANKIFEDKYGKKCVKLLTEIPRREIAGYVQNAAIYIMNSRWEVFPISLVEAMAAGIPFITSDVGIARFLPGGVIANSIDETQYWIDLLSQNEEIRKKLGEAGRVYAIENFKINKSVEKLLNLL